MLIPRKLVKLKNCAAKDSTRYAVNGVLVQREPNGKCLAAVTDGRVLCAVHWDDEHHRKEFPVGDNGPSVEPVEGFSTIMSTQQWADAFKSLPRRSIQDCGNRILIDESVEHPKLVVTTTDGVSTNRIEGERIEGDFPKFQDVIPNYTIGLDAVEIGVNPALMAELLKVMADVGTTDESKGVRLIIPVDPGRPLKMEAHSAEIDTTGVLMPVNLGNRGPHPSQNIGTLLKIAEMLLDTRFLTGDSKKDEWFETIKRATEDAEHVLVERLGYIDLVKAAFKPVKGWQWPAGLRDRSYQPKEFVDALRTKHEDLIQALKDAKALGKEADDDDPPASATIADPPAEAVDQDIVDAQNHTYTPVAADDDPPADLKLVDPPNDEEASTNALRGADPNPELGGRPAAWAANENAADANAIGLPANRDSNEKRITRASFKKHFEINRLYRLEVRNPDDSVRKMNGSSDRTCVEIRNMSIVFGTPQGKSWLDLKPGETYWLAGDVLIAACNDGETCRYTPINGAGKPEAKTRKTSARKAPKAKTPKPPAPKPGTVSVRLLRNDPDKYAPVSGCRCRDCGANANRAQFKPTDKWIVTDGSAYCPMCIAANATAGGKDGGS